MLTTITHRSIMEKWPLSKSGSRYQVLADDVGAKPVTVRAWHMRNRIPAVWWSRILKASEKRRLGVTFQHLIETIDREIQEKKNEI